MDMTNKVDRIRHYAKEYEDISYEEACERMTAMIIFDKVGSLDNVSDFDILGAFDVVNECDTWYEYGLSEDIESMIECPDLEEKEI